MPSWTRAHHEDQHHREGDLELDEEEAGAGRRRPTRRRLGDGRVLVVRQKLELFGYR